MVEHNKMSQSKTAKNICSSCRKPKPSNCTTKTCDVCKKRSALIRANKRKNKIECQATKQDGTKCTNKVSIKCGNKYCEKHIVEWKEYQETKGKQVRRCNSRTQCDPNKPGIKTILPNEYTKKKCENCLKRENKKDTERRNNRIEINKKTKDDKCCLKCGEEIKLDKIIVTTKGDVSLYCKKCFVRRKNIESNRGKRDRKNYYKSFDYYLKRAKKKGFEFEIPKEEFEKMQNDNCYYCDNPKKKYFQGVDRLNSSLGYIKHNIVPCCEICNMMKNTLNEATFILMCAHIAHFNNLYKSKSYPQIFNNYGNKTYVGYKLGAIKRNLKFEISPKIFENIAKKSCYLCGRYSDKYHCNGIDRCNNSIGYTLINCKSCCGDCNFMKKKLIFNDFRFRCAFIAENHKHRLDELFKLWTPSKFIVRRKKNNYIDLDTTIEI
jgi:ribosomal protein L21